MECQISTFSLGPFLLADFTAIESFGHYVTSQMERAVEFKYSERGGKIYNRFKSTVSKKVKNGSTISDFVT